MENNEQKQSATSAEAPVVAEAKAAAPVRGRKANNKLIYIVIAAVLGVALIACGIFYVVKQNVAKKQAADSKVYSIERDPETGERPLFGSDETKDNSGEAFVDFQNRIENAADSTNEEIFDARISKIVYYVAIEKFDDAEAILVNIDKDALSADELSRYYNVYANFYEAKGDTAKADEYRALSAEQ